MIRFVEHKDIDKPKWDACIEKSSNSNIFVFSWYLDIVCNNWAGLVLNDYEAVFPLAIKSKIKIHYLYQPFFTRYFGVYSKEGNSKDLLPEFFYAIPQKYKYMEFCIDHSAIDVPDLEITERKFQALEMNEPYENLYKNFSENAKRSIKKAAKSNLTVKENIEPQDIVSLFKSTKGQELEVFQPKDYVILTALMQECIKRKQAETIGIYDEYNNLCAGAFFMRSKNRFVFLKSGVSDNGKAIGAMHFLFDSFIKKHSSADKVLDFGGSSVESVARFYKNFGAKDYVYLQVKKNNLPVLVNWIKSLKK